MIKFYADLITELSDDREIFKKAQDEMKMALKNSKVHL